MRMCVVRAFGKPSYAAMMGSYTQPIEESPDVVFLNDLC